MAGHHVPSGLGSGPPGAPPACGPSQLPASGVWGSSIVREGAPSLSLWVPRPQRQRPRGPRCPPSSSASVSWPQQQPLAAAPWRPSPSRSRRLAAGARPRTRMLLPCARGALLGGRVGARAVGVPADPGDTCPPLPSESRLAVHCPPPDPEPSRSAISALRGVRGRLCQVTQSGQWPWPGSTWQQRWAPC